LYLLLVPIRKIGDLATDQVDLVEGR
jgi:hypothetical protein